MTDIVSSAQKDVEAKRELAKRLMEEETDEKKANAVSLLEDCVAIGDPDSMLMLGKCCALGRGMEQNVERAKVLLSESAKKGNSEAQFLMKIITSFQGEENIVFHG